MDNLDYFCLLESTTLWIPQLYQKEKNNKAVTTTRLPRSPRRLKSQVAPIKVLHALIWTQTNTKYITYEFMETTPYTARKTHSSQTYTSNSLAWTCRQSKQANKTINLPNQKSWLLSSENRMLKGAAVSELNVNSKPSEHLKFTHRIEFSLVLFYYNAR